MGIYIMMWRAKNNMRVKIENHVIYKTTTTHVIVIEIIRMIKIRGTSTVVKGRIQNTI